MESLLPTAGACLLLTALGSPRHRHALLAGGRSGGHVFPAVAVAEELVGRGWHVGMVGGRGELEERVARDRGLPFFELVARPLVGRGALGKLRALATLALSSLQARSLIRRLDPGVILGTGGYVSAPAVVGGRLAGKPVLLFEPNARPGLANRWLSRLADAAATAHEQTGRELRCASYVTGVPVRPAFFEIEPAQPDSSEVRLLLLGGSQGAQRLNEVLPTALAGLGRSPQISGRSIVVLHQAGRGKAEAAQSSYRNAGAVEREGALWLGSEVQVRVVEFVDDVVEAMAWSHLIVSRAGAVTLAEVCAAGRASLLVPLPLAAAHQEGNARSLSRSGAAEIVPESELHLVGAKLEELLGHPERLLAMATSARALARPDAGAAIADRLQELIAGQAS